MTHRARLEAIDGEKVTPEFVLASFLAYTPHEFKALFSFILKLLGEHRLSHLLNIAKPMTTGRLL
jgi:hypothetical protein